jgi:hypothetical protein
VDFRHAREHTLPFGKFQGQTLDDVASSDEGLRYLDWIRGQPDLPPVLNEALNSYFAYPPVARDLEDLLGDDG